MKKKKVENSGPVVTTFGSGDEWYADVEIGGEIYHTTEKQSCEDDARFVAIDWVNARAAAKAAYLSGQNNR